MHLDGHGFLLLVHVGGLSEFDVSGSDVSGRRELDALLGAGDDDGFAELTQILMIRNPILHGCDDKFLDIKHDRIRKILLP